MESIFGNEELVKDFKSLLGKLSKNKGSIITIAGDSGYGKSLVLESFNALASEEKSIMNGYSRAANPIGKLKVGNLQPLLPFTKAIEAIIDAPSRSAEKRFAMNVGMTLLASIPLIDSVFYAIKEIGKDYRDLKKEQSSAVLKKVSTAAADYYDTIRSLCDKSPVLLLLDDMQWADAQSVELLNLLANNIADIPIMIVLAFNSNQVEAGALPLLSFLSNAKKNELVSQFRLDKFGNPEINQAARHYLPNYIGNQDFEIWLKEKSIGNPLSIISYLKFFANSSPFDSDGAFNPQNLNNKSLPASIQSLISENMEKLNEEDKNILAVCCTEGSEFTVSIVSKLLNLDVLQSIKKLRGIQNRTGIIRSMGAIMKYGEKTTAYKFSQGFYHTYFEQTLEFEEYTSLHAQISAILKEKYNQTKTNEIKDQLAPYIAAHSAEAGDQETAESMILASAEYASRYGSPDVMTDLYSEYQSLIKPHSGAEITPGDENFKRLVKETSDNFEFGSGGAPINSMPAADNFNFLHSGVFNFKQHIDNLSVLFIDGKFDEAMIHIRDIKDNYRDVLSGDELLRLELFEAKVYIEQSDESKAQQLIASLDEKILNSQDDEIFCFYNNIKAIFEASQGNYDSSSYYLGLAATKAVELSPEMRLLTISNVSIILKESNNKKAQKYYIAAKKLAYDLNMQEFMQDLNNQIMN